MLTRKEADRLVRAYGAACIGVGYAQPGGPTYYSACLERDRLRPEIITALCTDPDAALLEACKRLYAICDGLTARHVMDLSDEAIARGTRGLIEGTDKIDLEWAKEAITAAEEKNRCQLAESGK